MSAIKFQDEPVALNRSSLFASQSASRPLSPGAQTAGIASLLLGLALRPHLTESEKSFLDQLAPDRCITFLVDNDRYLHPEDVPLFPLDLIKTTVDQCGQAICTHHYPDFRDRSTRYKVHTAVVNPGQDKPVVLGFFGPERELDSCRTENSFFRLASQFRCIHESLPQLARKVREQMASGRPTVIVNRSSGRIMALNDEAVQMLGPGEPNPTDREFGDIRDRFLQLRPGSKLTMRNLSEKDLHLAVVTLEGHLQPTPPPNVNSLFFNEIRDLGADLSAAADLLNNMAGENLTARQRRPLQDIMTAANRLNNRLARLDLLFNYDSLPVKAVSLRGEFAQAVADFNSTGARHASIAPEADVFDATMHVPVGAYRFLFEAILAAHTAGCPAPCRTLISCDQAGSLPHRELSFRTTASDPTATVLPHREWGAYAVRLADLMGVRFTRLALAENNSIVSDLRIERLP
ncbi:MAG: hypothetical protein OEW00_06825 [candidate division Zixibacteria bacterium]|nr:hypothetical protein [candidate division Zixibacteria bacterium]